MFPRDSKTTHTAAHISWSQQIITRTPIDKRSVKQGHTGSKKFRAVCQNCNNGWMSNLEKWAKPVVTSLALAQQCRLTPEATDRLATWAAKTAMIAELEKPRDTTISQSERTYLMEHQKPPDGWYVYIGTYQGRDWPELSIFQTRASLSRTPVSSPKGLTDYVQATTFGVGHLIFSVVSSSLPNAIDCFREWEPKGLLQIWPRRELCHFWPRQTIIDDDAAYWIANVLRNSDAFNHSFDPGANWTFTKFKRPAQ